MTRNTLLDPPPDEAAAVAAEVALEREVENTTRIEEGLNAVYRIDLMDGSRVILKAATLATDAELLPEPYLLSHLDRETDVPVPKVLAIVELDEGPLEVAYFVVSYCEGRHVPDVLTLPLSAHEQLVRETGRHLAAVHEMSLGDSFGNLRVHNGDLVVTPRYPSWTEWFDELTAEITDRLLGKGYVTDAEAHFADLEPTIRKALLNTRSTINEQQIAPAVLHGDYRPANLVLSDYDTDESFIRAVLDFGAMTGDGLLDLALAEEALIDVPLGGTGRADQLRDALRATYVDNRGTDYDAGFDEWYPHYRLYARTRSLGSFSYFEQFTHENDPDDVAQRWRSFVHERLDEVE